MAHRVAAEQAQMDKRKNRRLIAGITALTLGLFAATLYAARGRRPAIDNLPFFWENDHTVEFENDAAGGNGWDFDADPPDPAPERVPTPVELPGKMILKVGEEEFNRVWINANGFVSLTHEEEDGTLTGVPWQFTAPGAATFAAVPDTVNVIAPFYADAVTRTPAADCPDGDDDGFLLSSECDVVYALLDGDVPVPDPDEEDPQPLPTFWKGLRVTWGFGGEGDSGGLAQQGGNPDVKNRFQLKLIDRSAAPKGQPGNGDFDIQFNYGDLPWESANTLVGLKVGGFTMDFSKFFDSFVLNTKLPLPPACEGGQAGSEADPSFNRNTPLLCNIITIEVRDGIPKLASYTADVSVQLLVGAPAPNPLATDTRIPLDVRIANGNDQQATNVRVKLELPNNTTIESAQQGVTCTPGVGSAVCTFGSLNAGTTETFTLQLRSMQNGMRLYSAEISADQYDFNELNNKFELPLDLMPSADVAITGCQASSASVTVGTTVTMTCNVTNNGPQNATGVVVTTPDLPGTVTFSTGNGCALAGASVRCGPISLALGAPPATFSMTLNAASAGTANVSATIDADQNDPNADNTRSASVTVAPRPDPPPPPPPPNGGGSLSMWLLLSLALLVRCRLSRAISP
jgi:uncharacterized repeat protein (TIGR01451 family)